MIRTVGVFVGVFAGVFLMLLVAVGQLGKIDHQTLAVVLAVSAVTGGVAAWRA